MVAPAFSSSGTALTSGSGTSASIVAPTGSTTGFVVTWIYLNGANQTITAPSGWSPVPFTAADSSAVSANTASQNSSSANGHGQHGIYGFWARSPSGAMYAFSWPTSVYRAGVAICYTNVVASGSPFDANPQGAQGQTANSTTSPPVSASALGADRLLVHAASNWAGGTWTAPTSYTKRVEIPTTDKVAYLSDLTKATSGSSGSVTATCAGSDERTAWIGALIGTTAAAGPPPGGFLPFLGAA